MKLKVKITGWSEGKRCSIKRTIETPEFTEQTVNFLGRTWTDSVFKQQVEWVDEKYFEIIVPLAEAEYLHPIEGFVGIEQKQKVKKINKRQQVIELAEVLLSDGPVEMKEIFLVSLTKQWPQIKGQSVENIFKIVFNTIDVSQAVSINHLKGITALLQGDKIVEIKSNESPTINLLD